MNSLITISRVALKPFRSRFMGSLIDNVMKTRVASYSSTIAVPSAESDKQYPENVRKLVDDISRLTLLEVTELNDLLKKTLNISDTPTMAYGVMSAAPQTASLEEESEEGLTAKTVQTAFTLKLTKYDGTKKVPLIKEIKTVVEGMNLVQAKKFVESVPQVIKANASKEEVEKLKASLEAVGAICEIE